MTWKLIVLFAVITVVSSEVRNYLVNLKKAENKLQAYANSKIVQLKQTCVRTTGYPFAYADVEEAVRQYGICTGKHVDYIVPTVFCTTYLKEYECFTQFKQYIYNCMDDLQKSELTKTEQALQDIAYQFCYTFQEKQTSFLLNGGEACFRNNKENFKSCVIDMAININSIPVESHDILKTYESEMCKITEKYDNCMVDSLHSCESKIPGNIFNDLYKEAYQNGYCESTLFAIYGISKANIWATLFN